MATNTDGREEIKPVAPTEQTKWRDPSLVGKYMVDPKTGLAGLFRSPDNGETWVLTDTVYGHVYNQDEVDNIWDNGAGHKVADEIKSATADLPNVRKQADEAVKFAESAIAASKVNSDAIVAQSEAISEAKSAMDSATAEIQQTAANAASDAAKIRADVAQVQSEVDTAKAANSASVEALKSDVSAAKQDLADVHDSLTKAQSAIEQNQKLINDSVTKITSDVSATKQDLANVHDSLTKAQAAAEQNQKAIDDSIAQINANVDATNQDLAGVRKDLTKAQSDITANQKAVNDNVAQINADITQDRKDIASAQQANADTAKQLDTYSKQATEQGKTIKSIQDKQDGFTATIANVQGNVTQVSDKVDGLSASLKDAQDNVASVKAQADQLSATLTDHAKSIATLTASAKELSSTLEDADGRLSKVEQTAQTNSSTLSDVQGDLSQVKQNATKLVSTLKDAQGNISTLQQKADSVSAQLATAQGDIATLQTGVDSVKATLASHDKTIHTLQLDSKSLKDSMADAQGDISTLSKTATSLDSEMKDHAGRLSKVEQSATMQATTLSDLQGNLTQVKQQADGLVTTLKDAQGSITQIQQKADGTLEQLKSAQGDIASLQTDVTGIKATLVSHEGDIHTLQLDSKTLKDNMADAKGNISSLQKTADSVESSLEDASGRLSKVEQTANEHTSTISDLGDKLNNMKIGGRNLLIGTSTDEKSGKSYNFADYQISGGLKPNTTYTLSGWARVDQKAIDNNQNVFVCAYSDDWQWSIWLNITKSLTSQYGKVTFTTPSGKELWNNVTVYLSHPNGDSSQDSSSGQGFISKLKLEEGNVATDWTPAPEDLATVTQVKQTADGIETTLKSAQGDIDQIKQTAKGTSEQLSNVQGDVTNIQKDVNGLKQTTADNAGNIHTLQADSETLKDDMVDAKGNISSLQKTSTSLVSEFRDHDSRLSKVEQTATEHTSELADTKGNIDKVTQKANTLQLLLSDAQNNIQNIQIDAKGLHDTLTGQNNQLASLNVTLNNLDSKYSGITGELQSKQTALSTEQQQTKDMLLRKVDKSEVDNVKGTVNQVSAEQKTMADQINQKVSSAEYQTLKDKVNGMKIGGRNLLIGTSTDEKSGKSYNFADYQISGGLKPNTTYALSGWARVDQKAIDNNQNVFVCAYSDDWQWSIWLNITKSLTSQYGKVTFTTPSGKELWNNVTVYLSHPNGDSSQDSSSGQGFISKLKLEEGNVATDWTPAPEDTITAIQKNATAIDQTNKQISLKADQTEVNQVKGTASENSSRLDTMANEIKSKVTSTDVNNIVDGKGYATTSTVQSLITQKAGTINESITNLTNSFNNFQVGGRNYLQNSDKSIFGWAQDLGTLPNEALNQLAGKTITVSVDVEWKNFTSDSSTQNRLGFEAAVTGSDGKGYWFGAWKWPKTSSGKERISTQYTLPAGVTFTVNNNGQNGYVSINGSGKVSHVKIEIGNRMTDWSPAPEDTTTQIQSLTASIDGLQSRVTNYQNDTSSKYTQLSSLMQSKVSASDFNALKDKATWKSTDSIDLNTAVLQQKIFVKGGSNLPPGDYWWYVQVEPGYDSRIVQYAVSDRDNIHYSRQYDGSKWSAWSQGATESEITQLRDDINLRVKSGDLLSQINLTAGNTLIQSNKLYLDASSVVFSGRAFIPSAAIAEIDADKLTFYGNGTKATIGAGIAEYDQDKVKSTISMQYSGGFEIHSSNELGSILTMHDNTVRLAVKSQVYGSGSGQPLNQQYSGVWFGSNYTLMNTVDKEGKTTGWAIGSNKSGANNDYRAYLYDNSTSVQPNYGVGIGTTRFDVYAGNSQLFLGPDKGELRGSEHATLHGGTQTYVEGGNEQIYIHDGEVNIGNPNNIGSATGVHLQVFGWATFNGYVEAMGFNTKSTLSSKTRITPLDTADALDKITSTDLTTFQYKTEVAEGFTKRHAGPIIDDVNDVAQYRTPNAFISENRQGRSDADIIGYLMGAVQELTKQLNKLKKEVQING